MERPAKRHRNDGSNVSIERTSGWADSSGVSVDGLPATALRSDMAAVESPAAHEPASAHEPDGDRSDGDDDVGDLPCDTLVAIQVCANDFRQCAPEIRWPIVLKSQLYNVVTDHTVVDRELDQLRRAHTVRLFKLPLEAEDYAALPVDNYVSHVRQMADEAQQRTSGAGASSVFQWFIGRVLPRCTQVSISHNDLVRLLGTPAAGEDQRPRPKARSGHPVTGQHVAQLLKAGCIARQMRPASEGESYWFAIPEAGPVLKRVQDARKEIVSLLKKQPRYPEMLERQLLKKKLRASPFGMRFHVKDALGRGILKSVDTTSGKLIRLAK